MAQDASSARRTGHPAGFRTHIAVALGAGLFGIISVDGFDRFEAERA